MKKLKKLTTLVAACGLTVSAWAMAPEADAVAPLPTAEGGWAVVHYGWQYTGMPAGGVAYDLAMSFMQGAGAAAGGARRIRLRACRYYRRRRARRPVAPSASMTGFPAC